MSNKPAPDHENDVPANAAAHSGKAYQYIAAASAMAIQDATDNLRNLTTISTTAIGVAMAQMLETPGQAAEMQKVIETAQRLQNDAALHFKQVGENVASLLKQLPKE